NALVDADIFRPPPAGTVDRVIFFRLQLSKTLVDVIVVAELLGIGLMTLEIVQRGLDHIARLLVGADHVHRMADGVHGLLEHENLVFFAELADQHQNLLAWHPSSSLNAKDLFRSSK